MSQRKEKHKRRATRKHLAPEALYPRSLLDVLQEQVQTYGSPVSPASSEEPSSNTSLVQGRSSIHPLEITLEPAVILYLLEFFEHGGPTEREIEEARAFGQILASQGDHLLYRSKKPGETANLFNGLAKSVAILAHLPGGVTLFGGRCFDAEQIIAGFAGMEAARTYRSRTPFERNL